MSEMVIVILVGSFGYPLWLFVVLGIFSIAKSIFDHIKKFDNPLKLRKGFAIAFKSSLVFFVCYFCLGFLLYFSNQLLDFMSWLAITYYTLAVSLLITIYSYYKMVTVFGKKGGLIDTITSVRKLWK